MFLYHLNVSSSLKSNQLKEPGKTAGVAILGLNFAEITPGIHAKLALLLNLKLPTVRLQCSIYSKF